MEKVFFAKPNKSYQKQLQSQKAFKNEFAWESESE